MILQRPFIHAPAFILLAITLLGRVALASEMSLGAIIMQLRSTVDATNTTGLNETFEDVTAKYLNDYFRAYYTRTEQMPKNYFSGSKLSTSSFGVYGVEGSFITTIEIEGTLSFNSDTLPSTAFVDTLLRNAFKGLNEQLYLDQLLKAEDAFLQNLTHLIIDINMGSFAESPKREDGSSATSNVGATSGFNEEEPRKNTGRTNGEKWMLAIICITSVVLVFVVLYCIYLWYQRQKKRKETDNDTKDNNIEPMKVIKLPVKQQSSSSQPPNRKEENKNVDVNNISPTSTATTTYSSPRSIGVPMDRPPPSPQRSMTSQESSMFTYTDNMSRFTTHNSTNRNQMKSVGSPFSKFSLDLPSVDLSMWRGGRQDPPAFQSDISVIAKQHDLSVIPEVRDVEAGFNKENNFRRSYSSNRHLSRKSRVTLDARQSRSRYSNRSETYFYNKNGRNDDNDSDTGIEVSADDVICDLKNLSMQIQQQRKITRSKRPVDR